MRFDSYIIFSLSDICILLCALCGCVCVKEARCTCVNIVPKYTSKFRKVYVLFCFTGELGSVTNEKIFLALENLSKKFGNRNVVLYWQCNFIVLLRCLILAFFGILDLASTRSTRVERTTGVILKKMTDLNTRFDSVQCNTSGEASIGLEFRGLLPISMKEGFEDLEAKLKNEIPFRNKFVSITILYHSLSEDEK